VIASLASCTYGIYLIHPLIYTIEKRVGLAEQAFLPILTFILALLTASFMRKIPLIRNCIQLIY